MAKKKRFFGEFIDSVRFIRSHAFLKTILVDVLFILLAFLSIQMIGLIVLSGSSDLALLKPHFDEVNSFVIDNPDLVGYENVVGNSMTTGIALAQSFFMKISIAALMFISLWIVLSSVAKGYIYSIFREYKPKKYMLKFSLYNLSWFLSWIGIIVLTYLIINDIMKPIMILIELLLIAFSTPIYRAAIRLSGKHNKNLSRFFGVLLKRQYKLVIPLILIMLVWIVIAFLYLLLFRLMPNNFGIILSLIIATVLISWSRYYYYLEIRKVMAK